MAGDSYSGVVDHLQPPLALLALASLPALLVPGLRWCPLVLYSALVAASAPMSLRLVAASGQQRLLSFAGFAALRAHARAMGMALATLKVGLAALRGRPQSSAN